MDSFPAIWLSCHNLPMWLYQSFSKPGVETQRIFCDLFPPMGVYPLGEHPEFKMPFIIRNHSGKGMEERLDMLIRNLKEKGYLL